MTDEKEKAMEQSQELKADRAEKKRSRKSEKAREAKADKPEAAPGSDKKQYEPPKPKQDYDAWFMQLAGERKISPNIKDSLKIHMVRYGFYEKGQFNEGLAHFGVQLP